MEENNVYGLSEEELQRVYFLVCKADMAQLVALSGLVSGVLEAVVKDAHESLALTLSKLDDKNKIEEAK